MGLSGGLAQHQLRGELGIAQAPGEQRRSPQLTIPPGSLNPNSPAFKSADPASPTPAAMGAFTLPATINEQAPAFLRATHAFQKVQPSSLSINQST